MSCLALLFIQSHPEDNEIGAGGTIARLADSGCEVYALTVTDGRYGMKGKGITHKEAAEIRHTEACKSIQLLGMKDAGFLGFSDQTKASIKTIAAQIAKVIDITATHPELVAMLKEIIGDLIVFFSDKLVFKNAAADYGSPWHQDYPYWGAATNFQCGSPWMMPPRRMAA